MKRMKQQDFDLLAYISTYCDVGDLRTFILETEKLSEETQFSGYCSTCSWEEIGVLRKDIYGKEDFFAIQYVGHVLNWIAQGRPAASYRFSQDEHPEVFEKIQDALPRITFPIEEIEFYRFAGYDDYEAEVNSFTKPSTVLLKPDELHAAYQVFSHLLDEGEQQWQMMLHKLEQEAKVY